METDGGGLRLRDWVKGQVTAGILSFESVFLTYMLTESGDTLHDRVLAGEAQELLGGELP